MWAVVLIALAQANPVCWKVSGVTKCVQQGNRPVHGEHTARAGGRSGAAVAAPFFAFATASGVGMGSACGCAAVTGAKGETVTWTRAGSAYCTKEGMATTGLTTTSMVLCGSNLPRVEADQGGVLGVRVEAAAATTLAAATSEDFSNVGWTSTATVTANTTTAPSNAATADTLSDVSGAAIQSSCQTVTTSSATQHTFSVYLTAGTIAKAGITMTGTGSSTGDCSNTTTALGATYTRLSCTSPAAYAGTLTSVTVCVQVGTVVADTGTIIAWGADHKVSAPYLTSYIPSSISTRAVEDNYATITGSSIAGTLSIAGTSWTVGVAQNSRHHGTFCSSGPTCPSAFVDSYTASGSAWTIDSDRFATTSVVQAFVAPGSNRVSSFYSANAPGGCLNGTCSTTTGAITAFVTGTQYLKLGQYSSINGSVDGVVSKVCLDPDPLRCR